MDLSIEEGEIPINTSTTISYVDGGHGNTMTPPIPPHNPCSNGQEGHDDGAGLVHEGGGTYKHQKVVARYRECLKNHAAAMGGNVTDGCGEFMPSGQVGTIQAFNCSACHCHRNFHRKEVEGDLLPPHDFFNFRRTKLLLGPPHHYNNHNNNILPPAAPEALRYPTLSTTVPLPHHMIMPCNIGGPLLEASESDEQEEGGVDRAAAAATASQLVKKRYRTKFSQEQKEKMLSFAEKVGWKIQKQEEAVVQQFSQEIGVKRRVLKVWMHNNKHNLAKKNHPPS